MPERDLVLEQLNAASEGYRDPLAAIDWQALSLNDWWLPPDCLSLSGLPAFDALPEAMRRRLSHFEFVHFLQVGLWLERLFMERMAAALHGTASVAAYAGRLHEIREEAGHSLMFLKLMDHAGVHLPASAFRPPALLTLAARRLPVDSLVFRLAVLIGEDVPDKFNRRIRAGAASISPVVARITQLHMMDEARHIARARLELDAAIARLHPLVRRVLARAMAPLLRRFARTVFLPHAEVYELAGLAPGVRWRKAARSNPARVELVRHCMQASLTLMKTAGLELSPPTL